MTDYKSKEFEEELKRIVAEDTNMELDDEAMEAASGGAGLGTSVLYKVGEKVYLRGHSDWIGSIEKVYPNDKNPLYSHYDVHFPGVVFSYIPHGSLVRVS